MVSKDEWNRIAEEMEDQIRAQNPDISEEDLETLMEVELHQMGMINDKGFPIVEWDK